MPQTWELLVDVDAGQASLMGTDKVWTGRVLGLNAYFIAVAWAGGRWSDNSGQHYGPATTEVYQLVGKTTRRHRLLHRRPRLLHFTVNSLSGVLSWETGAQLRNATTRERLVEVFNNTTEEAPE